MDDAYHDDVGYGGCTLTCSESRPLTLYGGGKLRASGNRVSEARPAPFAFLVPARTLANPIAR